MNGDRDGPAAGGTATSEVRSIRPWGITSQEMEFLSELGGFVRTPRTVKRLANVYRLLKACSVPPDQAALDGDDRTDPEFAVALTLAAVVTGFPKEAPEMFGRLHSTAAGSWVAFLDGVGDALDGRLVALLRTLTPRIGDVGLDAFRRWAPRVLQYSFVGAMRGPVGDRPSE